MSVGTLGKSFLLAIPLIIHTPTVDEILQGMWTSNRVAYECRDIRRIFSTGYSAHNSHSHCGLNLTQRVCGCQMEYPIAIFQNKVPAMRVIIEHLFE